MGILTDPEKSEKFSTIVTKYSNKASLITYLSGVIWFLLLAYKPYNSHSYFSENALLPGLVQGEFLHERDINNYYEDLKEEVKNHSSDMPSAWLMSKFNQLGFDTYTHNFTLHYPLGKQSKYQGKNVYAILRAPRAASTEAIVLTAPYRATVSLHPDTLPGIALLMAMAKFFSHKTYWAKDIIFLITAHEQIGMQAWLDAYHHTSSSSVLQSSELLGRSGVIQAAINLEILSNKVTSFDVKVEGLNGQLPNLDLFNLVVKLCRREGILVTFHQQIDPSNMQSDTFDGYWIMFKTMMKMILSQSSGIPNGNHGLFLRYHIEAVTLVGHKGSGNRHSFMPMGRIVEGIFRSLNNLLEKFHQSFFFYLLPATDSYISIGMYMPSYGLILASTVIKALAYWLECNKEDEQQKEKKQQKKSVENTIDTTDKFDYSLLAVVPFFAITHLLGVLLCISPRHITLLGSQYDVDSMHSVFYGAVLIIGFGILLPIFLDRKLTRTGLSPINWKLLKCVALIELGMVLGSTSVINFSLALILSVFYVPICVSLHPTKNRFKKLIQILFTLLLCPLLFLYLIILIDRILAGIKYSSLFETVHLGAERALLYSIVDDYIYGNWLFSAASTTLFPNWLLFWCILWTKPV